MYVSRLNRVVTLSPLSPLPPAGPGARAGSRGLSHSPCARSRASADRPPRASAARRRPLAPLPSSRSSSGTRARACASAISSRSPRAAHSPPPCARSSRLQAPRPSSPAIVPLPAPPCSLPCTGRMVGTKPASPRDPLETLLTRHPRCRARPTKPQVLASVVVVVGLGLV